MTLLRVAEPWLLALLPLATLPWWPRTRAVVVFSWLELAPRDAASRAVDIALRLLASLTIAVLVVAIAGPYRAEYPVEVVGRGAEIALVIDRSSSMDQALIAPTRHVDARTELEQLAGTLSGRQGGASKALAARHMLAAFVAQRSADRFATLFFSTLPLPVHDFTHKQDMVQAAIAAGGVGRGLAETDIGLALLRALDWFQERPYSGSRIILLVSDGGDHLEPAVRAQVSRRVRDERVSVYWIYIRSARSPNLADDDGKSGAAETVPEYFLHRFFKTLETPYRVYQADDPQSLTRAIADVNRLENLPITTVETVPRRDLAGVAFAAALIGVLALGVARRFELSSWA